jgi:hypothetical protein
MLDNERLLDELKRKEDVARKRRRRREYHSKPSRSWRSVLMTIVLVLISAIGYGAKTIIDERQPGSNDHTAQCRDGTYSNSAHRSGTCSGHGGVRKWINLPEY